MGHARLLELVSQGLGTLAHCPPCQRTLAEAGTGREVPSDLESRLFRKLQTIDDETSDRDLLASPSNHFEKLHGNQAGLHSIRVNGQWWLIFRWDGGRAEAQGVYLDDHSY